MRKSFSFLFFLFATIGSAFAQTNGTLTPNEPHDVGVYGGVGFYMGDFNEKNILYKPNIQGGVIYRYNFNRYFALRASVGYGTIEGSSADYYGSLPGFPVNGQLDFERSSIAFDGIMEFNFLPFSPTDTRAKVYFSPYLALGVGGNFLGENKVNNGVSHSIAASIYPELYGDKLFPQTVIFEIPIGFGLKFSPYRRFTLSVEWLFKKTFYDDIDGFTNRSTGAFDLYNHDWTSTLSLGITYRLGTAKPCKAYRSTSNPKNSLKGLSTPTYETKVSRKLKSRKGEK